MSQKFRANSKDSKYGLAIVTGGSSGIGNSVIEQVGKLDLAPLVFNLSRTNPASFSIDLNLRHLECDLSDRAQRGEAFTHLEHAIDQVAPEGPILLVNNAGFGLYGRVERHQPAEHLELIEVNLAALVELTLRLLPFLKRRGGSILNIASTSAFQATPFISTYGASKAFVLNWTLSLNEELRKYPNVHATCVCPGPTASNFFRRAGLIKGSVPSGYCHTSEHVAQQALNAVLRKRALTVVGWRNKVVAAFSSRMPKVLGTYLSGRVIGIFRNSQTSP